MEFLGAREGRPQDSALVLEGVPPRLEAQPAPAGGVHELLSTLRGLQTTERSGVQPPVEEATRHLVKLSV